MPFLLNFFGIVLIISILFCFKYPSVNWSLSYNVVGADAHIGPFPILWFDTPKLKPIGAKKRKILLIKVKFHRRADVGIGPYDGKTAR